MSDKAKTSFTVVVGAGAWDGRDWVTLSVTSDYGDASVGLSPDYARRTAAALLDWADEVERARSDAKAA